MNMLQACKKCSQLSHAYITVPLKHDLEDLLEKSQAAKAKLELFFNSINALLNDKGGYVVIHTEDPLGIGLFDQKVDQKLEEMIPDGSSYSDVFVRHSDEDHVYYRVRPRPGNRLLSVKNYKSSTSLSKGKGKMSSPQIVHLLAKVCTEKSTEETKRKNLELGSEPLLAGNTMHNLQPFRKSDVVETGKIPDAILQNQALGEPIAKHCLKEIEGTIHGCAPSHGSHFTYYGLDLVEEIYVAKGLKLTEMDRDIVKQIIESRSKRCAHVHFYDVKPETAKTSIIEIEIKHPNQQKKRQKKQLQEPILQKPVYFLEAFCESVTVQAKAFLTSDDLKKPDLKKYFTQSGQFKVWEYCWDKAEDYVPAFSKLPSGGMILFGPKEEKLLQNGKEVATGRFVVDGIVLSCDEQSRVKHFIQDKAKQMLWFGIHQPVDPVEVHFHKVQKPRENMMYMIEIFVKYYHGICFLPGGPELYRPSKSNPGNCEPVSFEQWSARLHDDILINMIRMQEAEFINSCSKADPIRVDLVCSPGTDSKTLDVSGKRQKVLKLGQQAIQFSSPAAEYLNNNTKGAF